MIRKGFGGFGLVLVLACSALASPAGAQSTYPTAAGATVKVPGVVPLQCNSSGAACAPITATNPAGPNQVVGNVASGATDSGNPVKVGGVYNSSPPSFTTGQRADLQLDSGGVLKAGIFGSGGAAIVDVGGWAADAQGNSTSLATRAIGFNYNGATEDRTRGDLNGTAVQPALSSTFWQYAAASGGIVSSTADVAAKTAAGASVRNYVCTIDISHAVLSATSEIVIKDNATVIWRGLLQTPATDVGSGAGKVIFTPCLRGSANVAVNVAMITSVTGGVYVNLTGYTGS